MTRSKNAPKPDGRAGASTAKPKAASPSRPSAPAPASKSGKTAALASPSPSSPSSRASGPKDTKGMKGMKVGALKSPVAKPGSPLHVQMPTPEKTRVVAICNQKGGCGKTTTVINVAAGLAALGQRVLVIDLDSQCNATTGLGVKIDEVEKSTFDLLMEPRADVIEEVILETDYENLHVAPGSIELSEFESRAASEIGRENKLKKAIILLQGLYDFILIDTPPSLGLLSVNALNAASEVHIALQAHPFAFDGLTLLMDTIGLVREELNPRLNVTGVVVTMYDSRTRISREIVERAQAMPELDGKLFETVVRQNIKLTEASKMRKPVMAYDPVCTGTQDYTNLCKEICAQNVVSKTTVGRKVATEENTQG